MKVHIIDDWYDTVRKLPAFDLLSKHQVKVWTKRAKNEDELARRLSGADVVVLYRDRTEITMNLARQLKGVSLIAMRGQYDHVDTEALTQSRILFCSKIAKDGPSLPTAELTLGLIIASLRYLPHQINSARDGKWQANAPLGRNVSGKTLGLYGYGGISKLVAGFSRQLGMKIYIWGSDDARIRAKIDGYEVPSSRRDFFSKSDVLSVHKRLTKDTRGEISDGDLQSMRPGSILINTSRAAVIMPGAVLSALNSGTIGIAALDVFDSEPVTDPEDPLINHPNVIPTPHVGFVTAEELNKQFSEIFKIINEFDAGNPIDMINPEAWKSNS